jgi:hypothetical protein
MLAANVHQYGAVSERETKGRWVKAYNWYNLLLDNGRERNELEVEREVEL